MVLEIIPPFLAFLVIGLSLKELDILNDVRIDVLNKVAFYVALPALVFDSTYSRSLSDIFSPRLTMGFLAVILLVGAISWMLNYKDPDFGRKSVSIVQSYHSNFGYMGLPIVGMALGDSAVAKASILLGFGSTVQILLTTTILVSLNKREELGILDRIEKVIVNPVIMALLLGLAFSYFQFNTPSGLESFVSLGQNLISWVSKTALPIALLGVGASIELVKPIDKASSIISVSFLKLVAMPLLGWLIFWLLKVESLGLMAGVIMLAMPTAVSTYIYSSELGGDRELASLNISLTTLLSMVTLSLVLLFLG